MDTQFAKFLQIGIVVEDMDSAVRHYSEDYGIGPWKMGYFDSINMPGLLVDGEKKNLEMRTAFCQIYGFEIELIQPISESKYKTWLDEHGPGIHHIAVITKDEFCKVIEEHQRLTGKKPWLHCKSEQIGLEFAMLDLIKELGIFVEIYNEDRQGGLEA